MKNGFANFFHNILKNAAKIFSGRNLLWNGLAILLTWIIVSTGLDWKWFVYFRFVPLAYLFPAFFIGGLLPIVLPFILFAIGRWNKDAKFLNTTFALGQAALLGDSLSGIVQSFYRPHSANLFPSGQIMAAQNLADISHGFRFGFLRGGVFWGWPSSHTTVAFSMAVALIMLFPKNKMVKILALIYALYIGLSVSMTIHWVLGICSRYHFWQYSRRCGREKFLPKGEGFDCQQTIN